MPQERSQKMEDKIITDEYLSVKAFADRAGITTQRVYQLLAKDLQDFCKVCEKVS